MNRSTRITGGTLTNPVSVMGVKVAKYYDLRVWNLFQNGICRLFNMLHESVSFRFTASRKDAGVAFAIYTLQKDREIPVFKTAAATTADLAAMYAHTPPATQKSVPVHNLGR